MDQEEVNEDQIFESIPQSIMCHFATHLTEFEMDYAEMDISTEFDEESLNKVLHFLFVDIKRYVVIDC